MPSTHPDGARLPVDVLSRVADFPGLPPLAEKLLPLDKVRDLYRRVRQSQDGFRLENLLAEMRVELRVDAADSARIPAKGPVVVVANHPFGVLDGAVLTVLLTRVRPDVKVMTTSCSATCLNSGVIASSLIRFTRTARSTAIVTL